MLSRLVGFSLKFRFVVLLLAALLLAGGIYVASTSPMDVFPEFAPPRVVVQVEAPGLPAADVERLVTTPIENAVNGVQGLINLRSSSIPGLSVITALFEDGTDIYRARQLVAERLSAESTHLPRGVQAPALLPLTSASDRVLMVGLTSDTVSPMDLRTIADWTFKRRLLSVPGVASVLVFGGDPKEYQVLFQPDKMKLLGVSLQEVLKAAGEANAVGGAGYLDTPLQRLSIRASGGVSARDDLGRTPVAFRQGTPIPLNQVAQVRLGSAIKVGDATINGKNGVILVINKQFGANTLEVTRNVEAAIEGLKASIPKGIVIEPRLFRQATFIEQAIGNLKVAIWLGCGLVVLILIAFLYDWRTAVISLTAIPLSLLAAIMTLRFFGQSINTMTLGGIAIAIGEVVDDAIIDVENIWRRIRLNRKTATPRPAHQVVLDASLEVRSAVVYASFIVSLVFFPIFFLGGVSGKIFAPLGYTYILAIMASLLVALTVTPAMSLWLLPNEEEHDSPLVRYLKGHYRRWLPWLLDHRAIVFGAAAAALAASLIAIPFLGGEFLPEFREPDFIVHVAESPSASLQESLRVGSALSERLLAVKGVTNVSQQLGRAELGEDIWGTNYSEMYLSIDAKGHDYQTVLRRVQDILEKTPGIVSSVKQFLRERIEEVISGVTAPVVVRIYGPDLETLLQKAQEAAGLMAGVRGVRALQVEQQVMVPQIEVVIRRQAAALYGLTPGALKDSVQTAFLGQPVGQVFDGDRFFDIVVRAPDTARAQLGSVRQLLIDTPSGARVPLETVADVRFSPTPNVINHENTFRRILVTCGADRDVASLTKDIERILSHGLALPQGYHVEYGGEYEAQQQSQRRILALGVVALFGIFILLYLDFRALRLSVLVMLSVPFALIGGVLAVVITGASVSLGSLVGFVTLFGIAVRNGIMLITHYRHLQEQEGMAFGRQLILRGAEERLSPILMTALAAALAILPLVIGGGKPGHEIEHPMAVVIIGGLFTSTLLNLIVLPALYERFGKVQDR
ncbi:MAG: efflux RND transporter permease subunit [Elusimicrobia bacterium]|nr:efflux RND transporter permease subunit [Elusimicrobiota bacterium]MDE2424433.1 efflux RND transporter permease subunit [Elusimicrobiota bacterium]